MEKPSHPRSEIEFITEGEKLLRKARKVSRRVRQRTRKAMGREPLPDPNAAHRSQGGPPHDHVADPDRPGGSL